MGLSIEIMHIFTRSKPAKKWCDYCC